MSTEAFNTMRKNLVESVTGSALDWLAYMGTDAALAAVPDTTPPRYVVAGTLADIVKLLLAAEAIHPPLTAPAPQTDNEQAIWLWDSAKAEAAMYVEAHCVDGETHARHIMNQTRPKLTAAPAPQQSELTAERIEELFMPMMPWLPSKHGLQQFARAVERETMISMLKAADAKIDFFADQAAPAAPVQTAEQGKFAERLYGPAPSVDERRDALHTLALIFAAAESDSAREACFEDMYREFLAVPRMSIFDSLTRHTGAEISTNHTFELDEFYEVDAVARVLAELSLTAPVQTSLEFTAELDRLLGRWASAAEDGSTSHEAIREKIISFIRVAAPVQAEQAQAETNTESVLDTLWQRVTDAREAAYTFGDTCKEAVEIALDGVLDMLVQADLALPAQAEQAAAVRAAEWMPIATVPMDGTEVLLYLPAPYNRVVKARWFDVWENWIEGDFPDPQDEYCGIGSQLPTHWTHLPAAPSTATSNDTGALGGKGAES